MEAKRDKFYNSRGERLRECINLIIKNGRANSPAEIARVTGTYNSMITEMCNGKRSVTDKAIFRMHNFYEEIDPKYIMTGDDTDLSNLPTTPVTKKAPERDKNDRLEECINRIIFSGKVKNYEEFSKKVGILPSNFGDIRHGRRALTNAKLNQIIAAFPEIDHEYVLTGVHSKKVNGEKIPEEKFLQPGLTSNEVNSRNESSGGYNGVVDMEAPEYRYEIQLFQLKRIDDDWHRVIGVNVILTQELLQVLADSNGFMKELIRLFDKKKTD